MRVLAARDDATGKRTAGLAPAPTLWESVLLLLHHAREKGCPGLAPGKTGFAGRRFDGFSLQPEPAWTGVAPAPPD